MRQKIIAGNWKMNKTKVETDHFFSQLLESYQSSQHEVIFFVPYLSLELALEKTQNTDIKIGAQNMHYEKNGAYTGEISAGMLKDIQIRHVLIGHSERRQYFAETNQSVNLKLRKAIEEGIVPIVCVGENLQQRNSGETYSILEQQIKEGFNSVQFNESMTVAYEPVWAIGTGETATSEQAEEACMKIRSFLFDLYGESAETIRILYGGSVKADNAKELMYMPNIDGALVGGASLTKEFIKIIQFDQ